MISTEKVDLITNANESTSVTVSKQNKWNEQPHIGKYKLIKTIGKGNFAKVKLAQHVTTGKKVAVKVIDKTALNNSSLQKLFREVKIMKTLDHPNIVKLFEVIESERHVYLVMEYAPKGEVFDYLVNNGRMKEKDARIRFREIVSAIQYCHQKNIVHRDLKAENLLLGSDNQIKIADFGFANLFDCKKQLDTFCGSPPYAAPELFQGRKYEGPEVDVWSLGVILYTLVSGSLPFDGHNMRELRERVLRGKYRIPFYMTTDCEMLLKKMLVVNPQKRYTLLDVMKDKWINIGYEDTLLQPFKEPAKSYDDPVKLAVMESLGFTKEEVFDSLYNSKFNNVTATYLLLDYEVNNALEISSKSDSVSSLKNISGSQSQKEQSKGTSQNTSSDSRGVSRSGSAVESRLNTKVNGESKDGGGTVIKTNHSPILDDESSNISITKGKSSLKHPTAAIKPSPSMGTTNTKSSDEMPQGTQTVSRSRPNPIRIPGIQPNIGSVTQRPNNEKNELNNGDNLLVPTKGATWVKRNNTFTYADKNTTSEIESKPVTRTKPVMNMFSHVTPATIPLPMEQPVAIQSHKKHVNDTLPKSSKKHDVKILHSSKTLLGSEETSKTDSVYDESIAKVNDKPTATGDILVTNTPSSNDSNILILSPEESQHTSKDQQNESIRVTTTTSSATNSVSGSKDKEENYPSLNKPRHIHSNNLFRSFTNKITSSKLIRRLTSQNPPSNRNKHIPESDDTGHPNDPWTPMDSSISTTEKRKVSASSDLSGEKRLSVEQTKAHQTVKPNQAKPRIMHLLFRKSLTSKLRPETIISETLKLIECIDEIEFTKVSQIDAFVIECQGKLKSEQGGNELINWEIEVFRLPRSSSFGIRIKKQSGSSTRYKAIYKLLINKLSPVLCVNSSH